jgi:RNA:NAD 2'-phosphotransferase (TPT1/KptA family)
LESKGKIKGAEGRYEIRITEIRAATGHHRAMYEARKLDTRISDLFDAGKPAEALPLAERALEMLRDRSHSHSYYWASFIQTGEWTNLEGKR